MAPKAHDQTTIGSRCKKVVQNPAICIWSFVSRKDVREKFEKQKEKNEKKKGRKRGKNHARNKKREKKKTESPL
jgi:hypothetical protein